MSMKTTTTPSYAQALAAGRKVGASKADDQSPMALSCDSAALQLLCGAVSAELVYNGAQASGLSPLTSATLLGRTRPPSPN